MQPCKVRVLTAQGHGPNSIFPHEQAWCELWLGDDQSSKKPTQAAHPKAPLMWNQVCELMSPRPEETQTLTVQLKGKLPAHEGVDEIGTGTCQVNLVSICCCIFMNAVLQISSC